MADEPGRSALQGADDARRSGRGRARRRSSWRPRRAAPTLDEFARPQVAAVLARHDGRHQRAAQRRGARTGVIHTARLRRHALRSCAATRPSGSTRTTLKNYRSAGQAAAARRPHADRARSPSASTTRAASLLPLDEDDARDARSASCVDEGVEAIAICLLWCVQAPRARAARRRDHRARRRRAIYVTALSDMLAAHRASTRAASRRRSTRSSARRSRAVDRSLGTTLQRARAAARAAADAVQRRRRARPRAPASSRVDFLLSGPVGGVVGSQSRRRGARRARTSSTTDMGGTSFDVGLVVDGEPLHAADHDVGRPARSRVPSVAVRDGRRRRRLDRPRRPTGCCRSARRAPAPCPGRRATARGGDGADRHRRRRRPRPASTPRTSSAGACKLDVDAARARRSATHVAEPLGMQRRGGGRGHQARSSTRGWPT